MSCTGFSVFPLVCVRIHTHAVDTSSPAVQGSSLCQFVSAQKHVCLSSPCVALKLETHTATVAAASAHWVSLCVVRGEEAAGSAADTFPVL